MRTDVRPQAVVGAAGLLQLLSWLWVLPTAQTAADSHLAGPVIPVLYLSAGTICLLALALGFRAMARARSRAVAGVYWSCLACSVVGLSACTVALSTLECTRCLTSG